MDYIIDNVDYFSLEETFECGQAFRWKKLDEEYYEGFALDNYLKIRKIDDSIILYDTSEEEYTSFWKHYFDFDRDYVAITDFLSGNSTLRQMVSKSYGIRILNQDPWETVCSFIISQNNNIKRIAGIIESFCTYFGQKTDNGYAFPTFSDVAKLSVEDLAVIKSGFRAKYIIDAARKFESGEILPEEVKKLPFETAVEKLREIYGVGEKVANCALLFGFGLFEAFPKDVWIKRALPQYFPHGFPKKYEKYGGLAQQYIFTYIRKVQNKGD